MNQIMMDFGDEPAKAGDEVVLFGPGDTASRQRRNWADVLGTISYEIVTRFTARFREPTLG